MEVLPVLGPEGTPTFRFGGAAGWKQFHTKDYVVSLEWWGNAGRQVDACMVIWPANRNTHDAGAYIIGRRQITRYCDEHMRPTDYAWREVYEALPVLGRMPLQQEAHALMDVILLHIDDLIHMPVASPAVRKHLAGEAMWEVEHKEKWTGKILRESVI